MDDPNTTTTEIQSDGSELAGAVRGRILRLHPMEAAGGVAGPISRRVQGWSNAGDLSSEIIGRWGRFHSAEDGQHGALPFTVAPSARTVRGTENVSGVSAAWPQAKSTGGMASTPVMQRAVTLNSKMGPDRFESYKAALVRSSTGSNLQRANVDHKTDLPPGSIVQRGQGPGVEPDVQASTVSQNNTSLPPTTAVTVQTIGRLYDGLGPRLVQRHASFAGLSNQDSLKMPVSGRQSGVVAPSVTSELVAQRKAIAGEAPLSNVTQSRGSEASEITRQKWGSAEMRPDQPASMPTVSASAVAASEGGHVSTAKAVGLPVVQAEHFHFMAPSAGRGGFLAREVLSRIQSGQAATADAPVAPVIRKKINVDSRKTLPAASGDGSAVSGVSAEVGSLPGALQLASSIQLLVSQPGSRSVPSTSFVQNRSSRPKSREIGVSRATATSGMTARPLPVGGSQPISRVAAISGKNIPPTSLSPVAGSVDPSVSRNHGHSGFPLIRMAADSLQGGSASPMINSKAGATIADAIGSWRPIVQRTTGAAMTAESDASASTTAATAAVPTAEAATPLAPPTSEAATAGSVDLERLADQIYQIIERRLIAEKESRGL